MINFYIWVATQLTLNYFNPNKNILGSKTRCFHTVINVAKKTGQPEFQENYLSKKEVHVRTSVSIKPNIRLRVILGTMNNLKVKPLLLRHIFLTCILQIFTMNIDIQKHWHVVEVHCAR